MEHGRPNWELDVSESPAVRARWSSEAHTGRAAARLEVLKDAPGEWALVRTAPKNSRQLQARPGETYRVAFWCRRVKGAPRFYLDFYGGTLESDGPETYPALPADTNWHKRVVLVRAPDGPADALLALRFVAHSEAGTLLLDDVQAEPSNPAILAVGPYQARD
jgi:hypothetical protein